MDVEKRYCEICEENMTPQLYQIPFDLSKFLMLHLKRFNGSGNTTNNQTVKNHVQVDVDFEVELPYHGNKEVLYKLIAVICHEGEASSGHYTTILIEENKDELVFNM